MGIKKYYAIRDNTITNAFDLSLKTRGTGSNMGASDILEVFSVYGQETTSSAELSRVLIQFPVTSSGGIKEARARGDIPASGSVSFYLRMFNARHSEQVPSKAKLNILAVSSSWQEGYGLDMEGYTDKTKGTIDGSNWMRAKRNDISATGQLILQGGANKATMHNQTFTLIDTAGTSQEFTFTISNDTVTGGTIGMSSDSNTTAIIDSIKSAINNVTSLKITAGTAVPTGDADSEMTLPLTQDDTGIAGNTAIDVSGVAHLTSTPFSGGHGLWAKAGGDYHTSREEAHHSAVIYSADFEEGTEDLEIDVSELVEQWIKGPASTGKEDYGFGLFLTSSQEAYQSNATNADEDEILHNPGGSTNSFYTKRFFSRSSEFFFKRPVLEARWDSRTLDDRNNFYAKSLLLSDADNTYNLYMYNYVRGELKDIPSYASGTLSVRLYPSENDLPKNASNHLAQFTAEKESTGVYKASVFLDTTSSVVHDIWYKTADVETQYRTGSLPVKTHTGLLSNDYSEYTSKITNLKPKYTDKETARFRVFTRPRNHDYTIYSVASKEVDVAIVPSASFQVVRMVDSETVISHGTGSSRYHTFLSYDNSGSYFDLDMSMLEKGYMYGIKLAYYTSAGWRDQEEVFKFRVEDN